LQIVKTLSTQENLNVFTLINDPKVASRVSSEKGKKYGENLMGGLLVINNLVINILVMVTNNLVTNNLVSWQFGN